jgi:hypothetical protein
MRDINRSFHKFEFQFIAGYPDPLYFKDENHLIEIVLKEFSAVELRELRDFLNKIVAEWSDEELEKLWNSGPSEYYIVPLRSFFQLCIDHIDALDLPADQPGK